MASSAPPGYRLGVLGPVTVWVDGDPVPLRPAELRIVGFLATRRGETSSADVILDQVWEGEPPQGARKTLGFHISHARRTLREAGSESPVIETATGGYRLDIELGAIDADEFEAQVKKAAAVVADAPETAQALTERSLDLWRGEAYDGLYGIDAVTLEARRLDDVRLHARELRIRSMIASGRAEQAVPDALQVAGEHPHRESAQALVMLALYESGRQREALAFFDRARAALVEETGLEASRELSNLASRIARQDAGLDPTAGFDTEITAALIPGTPFVGRETELNQLEHALDEERLVSIVGSGGVGKTRLAGELLSSSIATHHAAYLGPLRTADGIPAAIAEAMGVSIPAGGGSLPAIAAQIESTPMVLLLDNAEHLLDSVRAAVGELLSRAPDLTIAVTTRQPLGLPGEWVLQLEPLSTSMHDPGATPAARMFAAAAERINPGFELDEVSAPIVDAITRRLDGLPLAMELAAAQLRRTSLTELNSLIETNYALLAAPRGTRAARHSTLTAALEWSYRMLPSDSQQTLRIFSAFRGGATLGALAAVADDDSDALIDRVLDLVDRSLVNFDAGAAESRYWILETTRRHLLDLTSHEERAALADRHLEWAAGLVSRTAPELSTSGEAAARSSLEIEEHNLRSALEWAIQTWPEVGMAIIGELKLYLVAKDHLSSEARSAVRALDQMEVDASDRTVASFQACAGVLEFLAGSLEQAIPHYEKALAHLHGTDDEPARFRSRNELALALVEAGHPGKAKKLLTENRRWADESGRPGFTAQVSMLEAQVAGPERQDVSLLDARHESEEAGRISSVAYVTEMRGWLLVQTGDLGLAEQEFRRSTGIWEEVGNEGAINSSLCGVGVSQWMSGDTEAALKTLADAVDLGRKSAWSRGHARALNRLAIAFRSAGDLDRSADCLAEAIAVWSDLPTQPGLAHARLLESDLAAAAGDATRAVSSAERALPIWAQFNRADGVAACHSRIAAATDSVEARLDALRSQAGAWTKPFPLNGSLFPEVYTGRRWLADFDAVDSDSTAGASDLAAALRDPSVSKWDRVVEAAVAFSRED